MFRFVFTQVAFALALLACLLQIAAGAPTQEKRDVFVPPVLYPHNGTVWTKGQHHNVTWYVLACIWSSRAEGGVVR